MGNSPSTARQLLLVDVDDQAFWDSSPLLQQFRVDSQLPAGSGRMMRTVRLVHPQKQVTCVGKLMYVPVSLNITEQQEEIQRLQTLLKDQTHVVTWSCLMASNSVRINNQLVRPTLLLRPHLYTTLRDRLASRPFLDSIEQVWLTTQLLSALEHMHAANVVHGFVSTMNIGLTSAGWLVLMDCSSVYKPFTQLPDDDPSDYLFAFHSDRCYLAPERFCKPQSSTTSTTTNTQDYETVKKNHPSLTPAMDLFAAGCVLVELFLNGERCMDLGDLMEYRRGNGSIVQQKLAKLEHATIRAACRHMLSLEPSDRLSAKVYLERLEAQEDTVPSSLKTLTDLVERTTSVMTPDAKITMAVQEYANIIWECMGVQDLDNTIQFERMLGPDTVGSKQQKEQIQAHLSPKTVMSVENLFAETEELLKLLEAVDLGKNDLATTASMDDSSKTKSDAEVKQVNKTAHRSVLCKNSLLIYLQLILSTIRHVQRPASKLVALQLVKSLLVHTSDEARLQRIVPVLVSMLHDQDPLVRASVIQVLTHTLSIIESFSPSDSKVFPQYIFKRVAHLISDPSVLVRIAFAESIALLAEAALRFLDITHAVCLYEAVGNGTGAATPAEEGSHNHHEENVVFADDVAKLLDTADSSRHSRTSVSSSKSECASPAAGTLIHSTYKADLSGLQETVSRWMVHITTDQAEDAAPAKRALLSDLGRLCTFFGLEGVMSFILPQILAFLNDRKNWELRAALFDAIPLVCQVMGRAATEEFVLPCVEIGLVDIEECVISRSLYCLSRLIENSLLSRSVIVGSGKTPSLLKRYGALLVHPSPCVRMGAIQTFVAACAAVGSHDCDLFLVPVLRCHFRYRPQVSKLLASESFGACLKDAWSRERYIDELKRWTTYLQHAATSENDRAWTSVGVHIRELEEAVETIDSPKDKEDPQLISIQSYLNMLAKHTFQSNSQSQSVSNTSRSRLEGGLEGSVKLAQSIMFPRQGQHQKAQFLPPWYGALREAAETQTTAASESTAIRSVSTLGRVYGLSIMGPAEGTTENIIDAADEADGGEEEVVNILRSPESMIIEGSILGQYGSETLIDPELCDTVLLVTKLKALGVPPLPPKLGQLIPNAVASTAQINRGSAKQLQPTDWKPRTNALVATSTRSSGHSAPVMRIAVAPDQTFFVSGSHDGTCCVWETHQIQNSVGILERSLVYKGHSESAAARINDVAIIEGTHSVVSGDSHGAIHVWRIEVESNTSAAQNDSEQKQVKTTGSNSVRTLKKEEGEILVVSHFNTLSASVVTFASQKGYIHSLDLRTASEPFVLKHGPELGHLSGVVLGNDRNWIVSGTSLGYVALWDVRFQKAVKLWRHSRRAPISRLGTSMAMRPQTWNSSKGPSEVRPSIFIAAGENECAMFDALSGTCYECFRVISADGRDVSSPPSLSDVNISSRRQAYLTPHASDPFSTRPRCLSSMESINALVGSIGGSNRQSYIITAGSDSTIRFWDFATPSKCFTVSGQSQTQIRPSFERIDFSEEQRLMLCHQPRSSSHPCNSNAFLGLKKPELSHHDAIQDLKVVDNIAHSFLISCSRDCTVKVWH